MPSRTVERVEFEEYLQEVYPDGAAGTGQARITEQHERESRLIAFPFTVLLKLSYPELDFASRWCWQQFGPAQGDCQQSSSEYPACLVSGPHSHEGRWVTHWLEKTDYDHGFNEWYFASQADQERFQAFVPHINWGECYSNPAAT